MSKYQRGHNEYQTKVHVAEATTGQLILYTCGVLGLMAFVFGAGVLVGRVDHSVNPPPGETAAAATTETPPVTPGISATETYTVPAFASREGEAPAAQEGEQAPAQSSPAATAGESAAPGITEDESARKADAVVAPDPDIPKPKNIFMPMTPRKTSMDPLPSNRAKPIQVEAPVREPKPDPTAAQEGEAPVQPSAGTPSTAVQAPTPSPQPSAQPPAAPTTIASAPAPAAPQKTPELTPVEAPIEDLPLEPLDPPQPEKTAVANVPAAGGHKFGIQLIAYNGADRRAKAEALCGKVQKDNGLQATIIPSEDDQYYRVVVVGYADRASADKALGEVRTKTGFKDAFIKPL